MPTEQAPWLPSSLFYNSIFMKNLFWLVPLCFFNCQMPKKMAANADLSPQFMVVLGIAQDAGYPQPYCGKACCEAVAKGKETRKHAALFLVSPFSRQITGQNLVVDGGWASVGVPPY